MLNKVNMWSNKKIGKMEIKNRIVRSATNEHLGTLEGHVTDDFINVYKSLAKSGIGLIITAYMDVDKNHVSDRTHILINDEENLDKLKLLTSEVHKYDSKIIAQIGHAGHRASDVLGQVAVSPSDTEESIAMTQGEINECIVNFVNAIKNAKATGFDGVQLHAAHGYLLSEFLDPFYNKRNDSFGCNVYNRYRIIHEILVEVQKIKSSDFIITAKIDTTSSDYKNIDFIEDQIKVCTWLEKDGIDAIELSGNDYMELKKDIPFYLENALKIKEKVSIPLMVVGNFRKADQITNALEKGIDFVSMSRPFIAEENFAQKLKNNEDSICVNCNSCFEIFATEHKRCALHKKTIRQLELNYPKK